MERATAGDRCVFSSVCVCPVLGNFAALHRSPTFKSNVAKATRSFNVRNRQ